MMFHTPEESAPIGLRSGRTPRGGQIKDQTPCGDCRAGGHGGVGEVRRADDRSRGENPKES